VNKVWETCPDCMRSDGHHPFCPSEHLPLAGQIDIDERADYEYDRVKDDQLAEKNNV